MKRFLWWLRYRLERWGEDLDAYLVNDEKRDEQLKEFIPQQRLQTVSARVFYPDGTQAMKVWVRTIVDYGWGWDDKNALKIPGKPFALKSEE